MNRTVMNTFVGFLLIVITGCGFQLRGAANIPESLKTMYVQGVNFQSGIGLELKRGLASNGVTVLPTFQEGSAVLSLFDAKSERRVLSVGGDAKVREYQLYSAVTVKLVNADNEVMIASDRIEALRDYVFDQDQVLASDQEEALLRRELNEQLARNILRRLSVLQ